MGNSIPSIVVTGISGNLGRQLLPLLGAFRVVGVDFRPPKTDQPLQFEQMDLLKKRRAFSSSNCFATCDLWR